MSAPKLTSEPDLLAEAAIDPKTSWVSLGSLKEARKGGGFIERQWTSAFSDTNSTSKPPALCLISRAASSDSYLGKQQNDKERFRLGRHRSVPVSNDVQQAALRLKPVPLLPLKLIAKSSSESRSTKQMVAHVEKERLKARASSAQARSRLVTSAPQSRDKPPVDSQLIDLDSYHPVLTPTIFATFWIYLSRLWASFCAFSPYTF